MKNERRTQNSQFSIPNSTFLRMLWIDDMEFDTSAHKSRLIEMISNLQRDWDVRLLTSHRYERVQPQAFQNEISYYPEVAIPGLKRVARYAVQCPAYRSLLKTFRPNFVLIHSYNIALLRYAAGRRRRKGVKLIYDVRTVPVETSTMRNWANGRLQAACLRYAAKHFDGITYITDHMRQYCAEQYGLGDHRYAVWTSGVNGDLFYPSAERNGHGPFTILYHGHIEGQRRIDNVIRALPLLDDIDVHFSLLGNADGLEELREIAENLGVEDRVSFDESVNYEDVPDRIRSCDAGILPLQDWYGWNVSSPLKLFEYLACGKPVIVTDIPAHRNVLEDSEFAFWAKQSSPTHIAEAIRRAYNSRNDFARLSSKARDLALQKYTWEKQAEKLRLFCQSLLPR